MHSLTIVMALKHEHVSLLLEGYSENNATGYTYDECMCIYHSADHNTPNPDCPDCEGTGKVLFPTCPNGKWDWYEDDQAKGGWPDYVVPTKPGEEEDGLPAVILTPDRGWLEAWTYHDEPGKWADVYWEAYNEAIKEGYKPFVVDVHD